MFGPVLGGVADIGVLKAVKLKRASLVETWTSCGLSDANAEKVLPVRAISEQGKHREE